MRDLREGRTSIPLKELAEGPWATDDPPDSPWFGRIVSSARAAGYSPRVTVNPQDFATVLGFVATERGAQQDSGRDSGQDLTRDTGRDLLLEGAGASGVS